MAITDAQQAKQIMMQDGGVPQLVKKGKGKKRPGYRGVGGYRGGPGGSGGGVGREQAGSKGSGFETGRNVGRDPNETPADDRGTRQQNLNQQRVLLLFIRFTF